MHDIQPPKDERKRGNGIDRRSFIKATLIAGGALLIESAFPVRSRAEERFGIAAVQPPAAFQPNAFIRLAPDGRVTVIVGQAEMGQGVLTSLPQIVADELEVDWNAVSYEHGPAGQAYANPAFGAQITGGSASIKGFFGPLRKSAASVREMLVMAAAQKWNVAPDTCKAMNGTVVHTPTKRVAKYGDLLGDAAKIKPPENPKLKDPKDFKFIGKSVKRLDTPEKVNGTGIFGIDVKVPGMLTATILRSPVIGGKIKSIDDAAAKAVKGV
ncbi:MAG: xanthine dehydrogenase family protein molybdopterin-binding subunit, partial [Acidobacteria bacterium]|nr:xanthine dehydrogenase family protein molybdopterin-binding subunit [Acidobacteriota bacterium]